MAQQQHHHYHHHHQQQQQQQHFINIGIVPEYDILFYHL